MKTKSLISFLLPLASVAAAETPSNNPNVILIYVDDMGIGDIGCYGGKFTPTPNIDRLAEDGLKMEQYYAAAPVSSPSRCSLITGRFPLSCGINTFLSKREHNRNCEQKDFLSPDLPSMVRAFQQAGYATAHIGKWHLGGGRDVYDAPSIIEYGYDEYLSTYESPDPDSAITATEWIWSEKDSIKRWNRTKYFVDKSIEFIKKHKEKPFFLNLWPDDMHTPWVPECLADDKKSRFSEKAFIPVLSEFDRQIGRLVAALDDMNLSPNTILIFTSDNGPDPSFSQLRSAGLRGTKNSLYEGGIRMPFIIKYPARIKPGTINTNTVVCSVDLYPSLCSIAGIHTEKGYEGDGADMSKALLCREETLRKKDLMWDFGRNEYFKYPNESFNKSPHLAIRSGKWKLLVNSDKTEMQLYDIENDKYEKNNLVSSHKYIAETLADKVITWYNTNK